MKILCVIFVCFSFLPDIRAEYGGLYPKELMNISYSNFKGCGIDDFWVDGDYLYILDKANQQIIEVSIPSKQITKKYKPKHSWLSRDTDFVVMNDKIYVWTEDFLKVIDKTTNEFREVFYGSKIYSKLLIQNGNLYVTSNTGDPVFKVWDSNLIEPNMIQKVWGFLDQNDTKVTFRFDGVGRNSKKIINIHNKNILSHSFTLDINGIFSYIGGDSDGFYLNELKRVDDNYDPIRRDRLLYYSMKSKTIEIDMILPQVYWAPLEKNLIFSGNRLYYLLAAKDGLYLFVMEKTKEKYKNNLFDKFKGQENNIYHKLEILKK